MVKVTLIRGDGIGPEIADAAMEIIAASGARIEWDERLAGMAAIPVHGAPLPQETLESIRQNRFALKGPLHTPVGGGYASVNVALRQEFELYANVRPAKTYEGVKTPFAGVDLVMIRENTEGFYSGIQFFTDLKKSSAQSIGVTTRAASERVVKFAFEYARANGRKKVTLVHKANILKLTTGMFLQVGRDLATQYPDLEFNDRLIDNMAMQLVTKPQQFDVIVTTNLFGDILSDLCAGLVGGLGLAPSANIGDEAAIFEAVHGTAPDIAGRGIANPTSLVLSGAMLLRRVGNGQEATRVEQAVRAVIAEGKHLTTDLGGTASTRDFARAVVERLRG
ncbi:MAG: isocitrate/isopropylmalate dehydrogenase family protein [Deltaproteobacteria bacterium]|nr:isocitrate/isopropylmalate dehydrogenase family protein [Deltaproteobacteria bacterium]